mmetsp:Transcript_8854/g.19152  ORF Transcript_8854/g.19152 Transcript_8854/m.19152 type:complete len:93 (+) Transcript_8854:498-776(+)
MVNNFGLVEEKMNLLLPPPRGGEMFLPTSFVDDFRLHFRGNLGEKRFLMLTTKRNLHRLGIGIWIVSCYLLRYQYWMTTQIAMHLINCGLNS